MKQDCLSVLMYMKFIPKWDGGQYVLLPFVSQLTTQGLDYKDMLTYVSLKSFNNDEDLCFPMHVTIGKKVGLSKRFVIHSIKRLENAGLITVKRSEIKHKSNYYYFEELMSPLKIPTAFFEITDLTNSEKGMLLCLLRLIVTGTTKDIHGLAKALGLTYQQVYKQYNNLVSKGYILQGKSSKLNTAKLDCSFGLHPQPAAKVNYKPLKIS